MIPKRNHPPIIPAIQRAFHFVASAKAGRRATSMIPQRTTASDAKLTKTNSAWVMLLPLSIEVRLVLESENHFVHVGSFAAESLSAVRSP